jgi:hypothetical protein
MEEMAVTARETLSMPRSNAQEEDRIFRGFFGAPMNVIDTLWNRVEAMVDDDHRGAQRKHDPDITIGHPQLCRVTIHPVHFGTLLNQWQLWPKQFPK